MLPDKELHHLYLVFGKLQPVPGLGRHDGSGLGVIGTLPLANVVKEEGEKQKIPFSFHLLPHLLVNVHNRVFGCGQFDDLLDSPYAVLVHRVRVVVVVLHLAVYRGEFGYELSKEIQFVHEKKRIVKPPVVPQDGEKYVPCGLGPAEIPVDEILRFSQRL